MCVTAALAATQVGLSLYGASKAEKANDAANARAEAGLVDTGTAIIQNLVLNTSEINRQISDVQTAEAEGLSDFERSARQYLGSLRAQETALTSGSQRRMFFENTVVTNENRGRIVSNANRATDALNASKKKVAQDALNSWTAAKNQTSNVIASNNASTDAAWLNGISGAVNAGVGYYNNQNLLKAQKAIP